MECQEKRIQKAESVRSLAGYEFNPTDDWWVLSRNRAVSFRKIKNVVTEDLMVGLRNVLSIYARTRNAATVVNSLYYIYRLCDWAHMHHGLVGQITKSILIGYRSQLSRDKEYYLGSVAGVLKTWAKLGEPGVEEDIFDTLEQFTLGRNRTGHFVASKDPVNGALTDGEFDSLLNGLVQAWELGEMSLDDYVLVSLLICTGRRPIQLSDLKIVDFVEGYDEVVGAAFFLNIPRAKQRGVGFRQEFKLVALSPEVGAAVKAYLASVKSRLKDLLGCFDEVLFSDFPFFPNWEGENGVFSVLGQGHLSTTGLADQFHLPSAQLSRRVKRITKSLQTYSERTGENLVIHPRRLRYTLGTRAAREGYGKFAIAELLDHSTVDYVDSYTENVPEHVDAINKAVAMQMAPISQAFAGVLVVAEAEARRGDDPRARIRVHAEEPGGTCGNYGFCSAPMPIACYTCAHFQPWLDGPHEELLERLISERERVLKLTSDSVVAGAQDRAIFAVAQVVQLCRGFKEDV